MVLVKFSGVSFSNAGNFTSHWRVCHALFRRSPDRSGDI